MMALMAGLWPVLEGHRSPFLKLPLNYFRLVRLIEQMLTRSHVSVSRFDTDVVSRTPSSASDLKSLAEKCYTE